jgi:hypothetical protein
MEMSMDLLWLILSGSVLAILLVIGLLVLYVPRFTDSFGDRRFPN